MDFEIYFGRKTEMDEYVLTQEMMEEFREYVNWKKKS